MARPLTDDQATIDRIPAQHAENSHREGLTPAEEVGAVAQRLDLGMSAAAVAGVGANGSYHPFLCADVVRI